VESASRRAPEASAMARRVKCALECAAGTFRAPASRRNVLRRWSSSGIGSTDGGRSQPSSADRLRHPV